MHFLARKAKSASKTAFKNLKKAVGIPTGPLSESNPRYYLVLHPLGALVREAEDLSSPSVYNLRQGDVVTCVELLGRRARLVDPVEGWVSLVSTSNEVLMELTFPPDKKTQVKTMNRRFDKLKEQQQRTETDSPIATPMVHRSNDEPIPVNDSVTNLKSKIVFKSSVQKVSSIPTLAGPRVFQQPSPQTNLLDLDVITPEKSNILEPTRENTLEKEDPFSFL